ncbi:6930_t:CDS:2, partial [Dentiscutata heterogama]
TPDKKDELIEALVKQVQQLSVNYVAATNQQEKDPCEKYRENPRPRREIVCYRCGEKGHIARHCMSEKKYQEPKEEERRPTDNVRRVNYCEYEENELYVVDKRKQQVQPDTPEKRPRLQPESKWDNRLRTRPENEPLQANVEDHVEPMRLDESRPIKKPKRKRGTSVIDKLVPYNIAEDLLNSRANATYGQLLQYPNQRSNLAQVLRRPLVAQEPKEIRIPQEVQEPQVIEQFLQNDNLDKEDKEKATTFFRQERNLFASGIQELGETNVITHRIETGEARPIKQKAYRASPSEHEFIEKELKEMEEREYYHHYFGFKPFVIITDHSALKWLHSTKLKGKRARWILRLQPYNYTIQHRSGRTHWNADALSRLNGAEEEVAEVYMAIEEGGKEELITENAEKQTSEIQLNLPKFEEVFDPRAQPIALLSFTKLGTKYRSNLEYTGPSKSYGNTYETYYHPTHFEHLAIEILDRRRAIYTIEFQGFNLIASEPEQLLVLRDWVISGANQELIRREYLRDTRIDLGYAEPLNVRAIEEEQNTNRREDRR